MKSVDKINKLADKIEAKLSKYGQVVTQTGTTELFFGDEGKQRAFASAAQAGAVAKFITDTATKTQKTASFDLKATAEPGKGAAWVLNVVPPTIKGSVSKLLDDTFKKVVGKSMTEAAAAAAAGAKSGGGSGTLDIASLSADMD